MAAAPAQRGLVIPGVFFGLMNDKCALAALQEIARAAGGGDPRGPWFLADNLITYGHTRGFLTDERFVAAVLASDPDSTERAIVWRTHTLCWGAENASSLPGD